MARYTSDVTIFPGEVLQPVWRFGVFPEGQGNMAFQMLRPDDGPDPAFTNYGDVEYVSVDPTAELILLWVDETTTWPGMTWENHGELVVKAPQGEARGYWAPSWGPDFANDGTLDVEGFRYAIAFQNWDAFHPLLRNSGVIFASSAGETRAVIFGNSATVENSGSITTVSSSPDQYHTAVAVQLLSGGVLTNTGEIRAESTVDGIRPIGVEILNYDTEITNTGLIVAKDAIRDNPYSPAAITLTNGAAGRIVGDVTFGLYWDRLTNDGWIDGQVGLGAGDDHYSGRGVVSGGVLGGEGNDTLIGGDAGDSLYGGDGDDSVTAGGGHNVVNGNKGADTIVGESAVGDWLLGGQGNDLIDATASTGHNIVNGNLGNDTLYGGSGGDSLRGGQGDDVIAGGAGNDWITGDLGSNTLAGGQGADTFHAGPGVNVVTDFTEGQGDRIGLDRGVTYQASQNGSDVHVDLSNGGHLILQHTSLADMPTGWILAL